MRPGTAALAKMLRGNRNRLADANLIAAAPELLEACKELVAGFAFAVQGGLTAKLIERGRAAIAKAEGR